MAEEYGAAIYYLNSAADEDDDSLKWEYTNQYSKNRAGIGGNPIYITYDNDHFTSHKNYNGPYKASKKVFNKRERDYDRYTRKFEKKHNPNLDAFYDEKTSTSHKNKENEDKDEDKDLFEMILDLSGPYKPVVKTVVNVIINIATKIWNWIF